MLKKIILVSVTLCALTSSAVPLRLISPKEVNVANGFVISTTGSYLLSDDVVCSNLSAAGTAITITSSNVTLDLNGKSLIGPTTFSTRVGIQINNRAGNVTIRNGTVSGFDFGITNYNGAFTDRSLTNNVLLERLTVDGCIYGIDFEAITAGIASNIYIRNCIVSNGGGTDAGAIGITVQQSNDVIIEDCIVSKQAGDDGINFSNVDNIVVQRCTIMGSGGTGISVGNQTDVLIENCKLIGNGTEGFSAAGTPTSRCVIRNCTASGNGTVGFLVPASSLHNVISGCSAHGSGTYGFFSDSTTSVLMGNIASGNTTANYGGSGAFAFIQVNSGGQMPPGSVVDPRIDNISIAPVSG